MIDEKSNNGDVEIEEEDASCGEIITNPFSPDDIKLSTPPMNLGDIIDMIENGYIEFDTEYQRSPDLWDKGKQSRLIESVLLGLRLPAFYFEEVSKKKWKIIDGLQRCCAIRNFCVDGSLKLEGLDFLKQFENKGYKNFPFDVKRDIRTLHVTVNLLGAGTPDDVKYILFKRLNTGGIALNSQEIRNAVYQGDAVNIISEMSKDSAFLQATMNKIPTKRMESMDFVSRFAAFYLIGYKKYEPDLDNFINSAMKGINNGEFNDMLKKMQNKFSKAMTLAWDIFKDDAFRKRVDAFDKRRPINKAYFEVISVCFAKLKSEQREQLLQNKDLFKAKLIEAMNEKSYNTAFSGGTGMRTSVEKRFSTFEKIMMDCIG